MPSLAIDAHGVVLADVLDRIRKTQPALFSQLVVAFHQKLDRETDVFKRTNPERLPTAQGRVQVADEILTVVDNCAGIVIEAQRKAALSQAPPKRGTP
jgi:hypothetical protein